jgi:hypothetical protein
MEIICKVSVRHCRGSEKSIEVMINDRVPSGIYIVVCGLMGTRCAHAEHVSIRLDRYSYTVQ